MSFDGIDHHDPVKIANWMTAMNQARLNNPMFRCLAMTRTGAPCQHVRMVGSSGRCHWHCVGLERDALDAKRTPRLIREAITGCKGEVGARKARAALARIARRELLRNWKKDPMIEGSTIGLMPGDEERLRLVLIREFGIDLDGLLPETNRPLSPALINEARWAVALWTQGKIDRRRAETRIILGRRREVRFFNRVQVVEVLP